MRKLLKRIAIIALLLLLGFVGTAIYFRQQQANLYADLQTSTLQSGPITVTIGATGSVRSNQSAYLVWKTSGEVDQVLFQVGDQVSQSDILATLASTSLPPYILLAQAELISAQRYLDGLLQSETQQALALKAVDEAQTALEQAFNPALALAQAQLDLAQAQADLEAAEYQYEIQISTPSQLSIDQAYANWILAQQGLADLQVDLETARNKANQNPDRYLPWENKDIYLQLVAALEAQESALKRRVEQAEQKYNNLLAPPDALDTKVTEAAIQTAQARLDEAQAEWERLQSGPSAGDIAVLEARLADAQREWERVKDGPDPADISIAEASIAAAQATLDSTQLRAPFDGTLTQLFIQPGDQIQPGNLALRIDDLSQILVDLQVSETDVNRIQPGLPVVLAFDAIPGRDFNGEVIEVAMVGTQFLGSVNFRVTVALQATDTDVRPGMTSEIAITIEQIADTLLVPNRAVRIVDGQALVYVLASGSNIATVNNRPLQEILTAGQGAAAQLLAIPITLGASSDQYSQVLEGDLQAGDEIVLNPPLVLTHGDGMSGPPPFVRR